MMYLRHFGLSIPPFPITPSTGFFFSGAGRRDLLEALVYAATHGDGIIKVTSEVGSGKTMLCRMLMNHLPPNVETVYLPNPAISREEVVYALADELGLDCGQMRPSSALRRVQRTLVEKYAQGRRVLVLIDEAHAMPCESLEELRLLYNLESDKGKLLHIILFGQTELDDKLALPRMRQLKDRIAHHFSIHPLSMEETREYLEFRMDAAGFQGRQAFARGAARAIYLESRGLMRRINILADRALLAAYVKGSKKVSAGHARAAVGEEGRKTASAWIFLIFMLLFSWPGKLGMPQMPQDILGERLKASIQVLALHESYTLRLFEVGKDRRDWLCRFLRDNAMDLHSIYVYPLKSGYLVVYGAYPSRLEAKKALKKLPDSYRKTYRPEVEPFPFIANS